MNFTGGEIMRYTLPTKAETSERVRHLVFIHQFIIDHASENQYEIWITEGVPDEPYYDILESIANDVNSYNDCFNLYFRILARISKNKDNEQVFNMLQESEKNSELLFNEIIKNI